MMPLVNKIPIQSEFAIGWCYLQWVSFTVDGRVSTTHIISHRAIGDPVPEIFGLVGDFLPSRLSDNVGEGLVWLVPVVLRTGTKVDTVLHYWAAIMGELELDCLEDLKCSVGCRY